MCIDRVCGRLLPRFIHSLTHSFTHLGRGEHDGVSGVDTEGIKILHVTDSDAIVIAITNHLIGGRGRVG